MTLWLPHAAHTEQDLLPRYTTLDCSQGHLMAPQPPKGWGGHLGQGTLNSISSLSGCLTLLPKLHEGTFLLCVRAVPSKRS